MENKSVKEKVKEIEEKPVKKRQEWEHHFLIRFKYAGSVRNYLLSMGRFKDTTPSLHEPNHSPHPRLSQNRGGELKPRSVCAEMDNGSPADIKSKESKIADEINKDYAKTKQGVQDEKKV